MVGLLKTKWLNSPLCLIINGVVNLYLYLWLHSPGQVESASLIELPTPQNDALKALRSCTSSLETFAQSFLNRALQKARDPERGSRSALIVHAHVFSWPPVRLRYVRGGVGRNRPLTSSPWGRLEAWPNQRSLVWTICSGMSERVRVCLTRRK